MLSGAFALLLPSFGVRHSALWAVAQKRAIKVSLLENVKSARKGNLQTNLIAQINRLCDIILLRPPPPPHSSPPCSLFIMFLLVIPICFLSDTRRQTHKRTYLHVSPPFSPSPISLMVPVDVKQHVYLHLHACTHRQARRQRDRLSLSLSLSLSLTHTHTHTTPLLGTQAHARTMCESKPEVLVIYYTCRSSQLLSQTSFVSQPHSLCMEAF